MQVSHINITKKTDRFEYEESLTNPADDANILMIAIANPFSQYCHVLTHLINFNHHKTWKEENLIKSLFGKYIYS